MKITMKIVEYKSKFGLAVSYDVFVNDKPVYSSEVNQSLSQISKQISAIYSSLKIIGDVNVENETIEVK